MMKRKIRYNPKTDVGYNPNPRTDASLQFLQDANNVAVKIEFCNFLLPLYNSSKTCCLIALMAGHDFAWESKKKIVLSISNSALLLQSHWS